MKTIIGVVLAGLILSVCVPPAARGAEETADKMTQGDMAQLLVRKLGLSRRLPASPTDFECIALLSQNGIFPSPTLLPTEANPMPGWNADAELTAEDTAVLLVRALGLAEKVEGDRADVANWVNVLKGIDVPFTPEGASVAVVKPLDGVLVAHTLFQISPDPLSKRFLSEAAVTDLLNLLLDRGPDASPAVEPPPVEEEGAKPEEVTPNFPILLKIKLS